MSQALVIYLAYASDVFLICWFGSHLTQYVRVNGILLFFLFLIGHVENAERFQQIRNLKLLSVVDPFL